MYEQAADSDIDSGKLNLPSLTALVVGSMIGGGIFSLPQNMAASSSAGAIIIAWSITFVGMLALAFVFQNLANHKPEISGGISGYARAGFGDFIGFNSAWGYWVAALIANVSFFVVFFSALGSFQALAFFGDGNSWQAIAAASCLLWLIHFTILRGVQAAALINTLATIAKVVPILLFIVLTLLAFEARTFYTDFWGDASLGSVLTQVKGSMLVTVWVFIGIEGAAMFTSRARDPSHVGRATVLGFLFTTVLLVAVSILALGVMKQPELAQLKNPSTGGVLAHVTGPWGESLIAIGLVISVGGALLAWTLLAAEVPYLAAKDGLFPACFAQRNSQGTPVISLWVTNGLVQLCLLLTLYSHAGYLALLLLATAMVLIPYLLCGAYAWMIAQRRDGYRDNDPSRRRDLAIGILATGYGAWLLYAAGLKYLLLSMILYAPGLVLFAMARRARGNRAFNRREGVLASLISMIAAVALFALEQGLIQLT